MKDSEDLIPLHNLSVVDHAKIASKTKYKVPLSRGKKRVLGIGIFALVVWLLRISYHRWQHFHYVQVTERHVSGVVSVVQEKSNDAWEATQKQVASTWRDVKDKYYYGISRPANFDCQLDDDTCNAALKAHPEWQAEAKEAIQHIWAGYCQKSFGHDNVDVMSGEPRASWVGAGIFVMDSLTTLWLAGMKKEFDDGVKFVATIDWGKVNNQNTLFFEVVIRALGGLLGAYDLSGEKILLQKAQELADRLLPAFKPHNPFPHNNINLITGKSNSPFGQNRHYLAELGTFQLEFRSLSYHTGDPKYQKFADEAMLTIMRVPGALRGLFVTVQKERNATATGVDALATAKDASSTLTIGGGTDSYYEYLLKLYIQSGFTEPHYLQKFKEVYEEGVQKLQATTKATGLTYWGEWTGNRLNNIWEHLSCFMGGSLVLGNGLLNQTQPDWKKTGTQLGQVCREMYARSPTGLAGERVAMDPKTDDPKKEVGPATTRDHNKGILRPEAVETWFYLHYFTGDPKYRQWAHEYLTAMNKHARTDYGYSEVKDVFVNPPVKDGHSESFVMAETVKYLYLIMSDRSTLDLTEFVFNTEAHPLKIIKEGIKPVL